MTSNLGSEYLLESDEEKALEVLKNTFRPEFINRIDEIVLFTSLSKDIVYNILDKIIKETENRLKDLNVSIHISDQAKEFIMNHSYEESYGARPIKRYVTHNIETLIAEKLIKDEIKMGSTINIDLEKEKLIIR